MTLQEKIIKLRKKNGWSQEELADKIYVTRQAVSKWESGQSLPDVEKIVHMSKLFGVTTDYLLNDEIGTEDIIEESASNDKKILEQADVDAFLDNARKRTKLCAIFLSLMFLSPVVFYILKLASVENYKLIGGIVGIVVFAIGFTIFAIADNIASPFNYIRKEQNFILGYGIGNYLEQIKAQNKKKNDICSTISTSLLMLVAMALILLMSLYKGTSNYGLISDISIVVSLIVMSAVVPLSIVAARENNTFNLLFKKRDYSQEKLELNKKLNFVRFIVTSVALLGYLVYMFLSKDDGNDILIFAGFGLIIDGIIEVILKYCYEQRKDKKQSTKDIESNNKD